MEDRNHHHETPGNGFLMGVIVGAATTLLFTTKKGREIVKDITEKGFERFSDLQTALEEDEFEAAGADYVEQPGLSQPAEVIKEKVAKEIKREESTKSHAANAAARSGKSTLRRFFKATKKN